MVSCLGRRRVLPDDRCAWLDGHSREKSSLRPYRPDSVLAYCISRSFRTEEAPIRKRSGVSQSSPSVSLTITSRCSAALLVETPPAALKPIDPPGPLEVVADRLEHHQAHTRRCARGGLAGRGLDEIGAGLHRQHRRVPHMVVGAELRRLEDHLQVRVAAGLLDPLDLAHHPDIVTREERLTRDHHVDLIGAGRDGVLGVTELGVERDLAGWEPGGDRRGPDARSGERLACRPRPATGTRRSRQRTGSPASSAPGRRPWRRADAPCRRCRRPRASSGRGPTRPGGSPAAWRWS